MSKYYPYSKLLIYTYVFFLLSVFLCQNIHTTSAVITVAMMSKNIPTVIDITIINFSVDPPGVTESAVTEVCTYVAMCIKQ